jgi:hypothetical protein
MKPNFNSQSDGVIRLFTGEGIFSIETCIEKSKEFMDHGREFIKESRIAKWYLSELYAYLKKSGDLPELIRERKLEIWKEANGDKLLAFSLYLLEVI